jgi:hypothetical protein
MIQGVAGMHIPRLYRNDVQEVEEENGTVFPA